MILLGDVIACMTRHNIPATVFGQQAVNDPALLPRLKSGRLPGPRNEKRIRDFIARTNAAGDPRFLTQDARALLLEQVLEYCARNDVSYARFGRAIRDEAVIANLRNQPNRFSVERGEKIRAFMRRHPKGFDHQIGRAATLEAAQERKAEIEARRQKTEAEHAARAERAREVAAREAAGIQPVAAVTHAAIGEPGEAMRLIKQRWPGLLDRLIAESRAVGRMPGELMAEAIEAGLDAMAGNTFNGEKA